MLRGQFLGKNHYILPKIAIFAHFGSRKVGKKQKIKKTFPTSCSKYPKVHFDPFLGQLKHFPQTYIIFRQKKNSEFLLIQQKNECFLSENRPILDGNFQNSGNQ